MNSKLFAGVAVIGLGLIGTASAAPIITGSATAPAPFSVVDFGSGLSSGKQATTGPITVGNETFTFTGNSGIYAGDTGGVALSPLRDDLSKGYLSSEPGGTMTITFATAQTSFNLIWGSIDDFNSLVFGAGGQTVTGADIASAIPGLAFGTSGAAVMISALDPFTSISVMSSSPAFEFAPGLAIPEPASLALLGIGLAGLAFVRRRA